MNIPFRTVGPLAIAIALTAVGCGGFDNQRFEAGEGAIRGATAPGAQVYVLYHAELATVADDDGSFVVRGVPAGATTLLMTAPKAASLYDVQVVADWTADAGVIRLRPASILTGLAEPGAIVWVPGTSLAVRADADGRWILPGVPAAGCVPLTAAGSPALQGCAADETEIDLTSGSPGPACSGLADCPVGIPCVGGACKWPVDISAPDVEPGPGENPDPVDEPDPVHEPQACEGAAGLGGTCGPPALCGADGVLECDDSGNLVCSVVDADPLQCGGFGKVFVVDELKLGEGRGFDLDNKDGDDDPTTGRDNALAAVSALLRLLDAALADALDLEDGQRGRYLIDVRSDRLRVYAGVETAPGEYEPRWSLLGDEGLPLGDLPLVADESGTLAGPASIDLAIAVAGHRLPFPLRRSYLSIDEAAGTGDIGAAVNIGSLLGFIRDARLRDFLEQVLSPGDIDTDGDGLGDSLSLAVGLSVSPAILR
jgi:hypothetical protein